ncbi:U-box domain-containing protein 41-like [Typha angustifolia]|uniref:U-box domain-containing protein 41-like n=1 Tax=Typha angustifolia TaxID=59011 RepID=UPI003C2E45A8
MGTGRPRWKLSFRRSPSTPTSPSSSFAAGKEQEPEPPMEFLCPISHSLMADPVIIPSGQTFERRCIQACVDLSFFPPSLSLSASASDSSPLLLIPNVALRVTIINWCKSSGLYPPSPPSSDAARNLVRRLIPSEADPNSRFSPPSSSTSYSSYRSSSSYPSSEIAPAAVEEAPNQETPRAQEISEASSDASAPTPALPPPCDSMEEEILTKLVDPEAQESAVASLRQATRESSERRLSLCSPRILAALRQTLLSRSPSIQVHAAAAMANLSLETPNKTRIVQSGGVPPLVESLKSADPEARDHAAGAIFSLALDEDNRAAIGVLGAISPLLHLFCSQSETHRARRDAGKALYHLSLAATNRTKIARTAGAVKALLSAAAEKGEIGRLAMMVVGNLAGSQEAKAALMDSGAVATAVGMVADGAGDEEFCIAALYGMSRGSLRFRGLAKAAGAEKVLMEVVERGGGGMGREMARRMLRAMKGEEEEVAAKVAALGMEVEEEVEVEVEEEEGSVVSEGLVSFRSRYQDFGCISRSNTAEF